MCEKSDGYKIHSLHLCLLSIYDCLVMADNSGIEEEESLTEMMFRKMKAYNIDLNKELGLTRLKPISKNEQA